MAMMGTQRVSPRF